MSSLQDLLNPASSGPSSPVHARNATPPPPRQLPHTNTQEAANTLTYFANRREHRQLSPQSNAQAAPHESSDTDTVESSSPVPPVSPRRIPAGSPLQNLKRATTNGYGHSSPVDRDAMGEQDEDYEMSGDGNVSDSHHRPGARAESDRASPAHLEVLRSSPPVTSASPPSTTAPTPADTTTVNTPAAGTPIATTSATTMPGKTKKSKAVKAPAPKKKGVAKPQKKKRKAAADGDDDLEDETATKKRQISTKKAGKKRESEVTSGYNTETDDQGPATRATSIRRDTTPLRPPSPAIPPSPVERHNAAGLELYCICRQPDSGKWMIACDGHCDDWYHGPRCTYKGHGRTTWKRKCRLTTCRRPADVTKRPPSKYCSDAHGVEFFELHLDSDRNQYTRAEIKAMANSVTNAADFRRIGERMPTPPPSDENWKDYPEESERLTKIAQEKVALKLRAEANSDRAKYIDWAKERAKRVHEEMKADPTIKHTGKEICGFDERLTLDQPEWEAFRASPTGLAIFQNHRIDDRDVCLKKKCERHANWRSIFADESQLQGRLVSERLVQLKHEERKIKDRQKKRSIRDSREGIVESGPWLS
ncbi:hypothetical protein L873DRAFT_1699785 [Choiromyces venosus 120613-1]|uniref:Zinc finger PHD-type domain-containing protein n=1 Tax=Choiromyces venosus 120613-1 TaxID=1336337 RepID=A0A3N4JEA7_9PEZI|nr:hypothetical protein L873DRAFT_1699785 [Choiromyces venosus 120613-1]